MGVACMTAHTHTRTRAHMFDAAVVRPRWTTRQLAMRRPAVMSQQHQVRKSGFWLEFFRLYRSMPELWLTNSKEYRNRKLKAASYDRLLQHMRQADPASNIHMLKRKINNLRTSYRRELRKVLESKSLSRSAEGEAAAAEQDEYVPTLWYYSELDFLYEQETGEAQTLLAPEEQQHRQQRRQRQHQLSELSEEHDDNIVEMSVQHAATDEANTLLKTSIFNVIDSIIAK